MENIMEEIENIHVVSRKLIRIYEQIAQQLDDDTDYMYDWYRKSIFHPLLNRHILHICNNNFTELKIVNGEDLTAELFKNYFKYHECRDRTITNDSSGNEITHLYLAPPIKPVMSIHVSGLSYLTGKRIQQTFTKYFSDMYDVVILDDTVNLKTDNMISINVDKNTDVDELIKSITNHFDNIKEV